MAAGWPLDLSPLPWLLEMSDPAVRHLALRDLVGCPPDDPGLTEARSAATISPPISSILDHQDPAGYWVKPGPGYSPKYRGTVWQVIFLDQLGADGNDSRVRHACEYVLAHSQAASGAFSASGSKGDAPPPPSTAIHCLNGNLLNALIGFGGLGDERVQRAVDWQANAIIGEGDIRYYRSGTSGPLFACAANEGLSCAWGAIPALLALARIPKPDRSPHVVRAIEQGASFLLGRDPVTADYPMGWGNTKPNASWFKLGFPAGYVADVLRNLEALCALSLADDPRLAHAFDWLLAQRGADGRWANRYAYRGKTWSDFDQQGRPSKWVTLRACRVLKARGHD